MIWAKHNIIYILCTYCGYFHKYLLSHLYFGRNCIIKTNKPRWRYTLSFRERGFRYNIFPIFISLLQFDMWSTRSTFHSSPAFKSSLDSANATIRSFGCGCIGTAIFGGMKALQDIIIRRMMERYCCFILLQWVKSPTDTVSTKQYILAISEQYRWCVPIHMFFQPPSLLIPLAQL